MTFGALLIKYSDVFGSDTNLTKNKEYVTQIQSDWTQLPFTEIYVQAGGEPCLAGDTQVFSSMWYGTEIGCDCLDACFSIGTPEDDTSICHEFLVNERCYNSYLDYGCMKAYPKPAVRMI